MSSARRALAKLNRRGALELPTARPFLAGPRQGTAPPPAAASGPVGAVAGDLATLGPLDLVLVTTTAERDTYHQLMAQRPLGDAALCRAQLRYLYVSIKHEGLVWAALFAAALLAATLGRFSLLMVGGVMLALGGLLWVLGGLDLEVPGPGDIRLSADLIQLPLIGEMRLENYAPWEPVLRHYFLYSNWHLFAYLVALSPVAAIVSLWRTPDQAWLRAGLVWALSSIAALYFLFFWTDAYLWAIQATSINRLQLHYMPALLFWSMTIWLEFQRRNVALVTISHSTPG